MPTPCCDFCSKPATYDFRTAFGPWANGCDAHWKVNRASSKVGLGHAQKLAK